MCTGTKYDKELPVVWQYEVGNVSLLKCYVVHVAIVLFIFADKLFNEVNRNDTFCSFGNMPCEAAEIRNKSKNS